MRDLAINESRMTRALGDGHKARGAIKAKAKQRMLDGFDKVTGEIGLSAHEQISMRAAAMRAVSDAESQFYCRIVLEQLLRDTTGQPYDMNQAHQAHRLFASVLFRAWPTVRFDILQHRSAIAWTGGPAVEEVRAVLGALARPGKTAVVYLNARGDVSDLPSAGSVSARAKTLPRLFRWDEVRVGEAA